MTRGKDQESMERCKAGPGPLSHLFPERLRVPGQRPGGLLSDPGAQLCARRRSQGLGMWGHGGR